MIISLSVIMIPILVVMWFFTRPSQTPVADVDWRPVAEQARSRSPYPIVVPERLPSGWRATQAAYTARGESQSDGSTAAGNTWRMAWLSPQQMYIGLAQRDSAGQQLVDQLGRSPHADGSSTVAGATWRRLATEDGRTRTLAIERQGVTTVVTGDVSYADLEAFAAALR